MVAQQTLTLLVGVRIPFPQFFILYKNIAECGSAWQSATFGTQRSRVRITSLRLGDIVRWILCKQDSGVFIYLMNERRTSTEMDEGDSIYLIFWENVVQYQRWDEQPTFRSVAQFGRALRSGRRGRVFESRHSDLKVLRFLILQGFRHFLFLSLECQNRVTSGFPITKFKLRLRGTLK